MQGKKLLLSGILCAFSFLCFSQSNSTGSISGRVTDPSGQPVPGAFIQLGGPDGAGGPRESGGTQESGGLDGRGGPDGANAADGRGPGVVSDEQGRYLLPGIAPGTHVVYVTALGFRAWSRKVEVSAGVVQTLSVSLEVQTDKLEEVTVIGYSKNQEVNRQAYNVTSIDARSLHNSTLDLSHALDRVSGVRVRETGGVGSNFTFSLNGFTGNHVRFFIDGIPMDNFGSSFQINNIPINIAERVEVYKGVVPVWLGSDALGGAVNIVTGNRQRNYLDVSYSYGSFNTHRSTVNAAVTSPSGLTFRLNAFQNYSDNNYWVEPEVSDINTGQYFGTPRIRRFHDNYHNETVIASVGVVDKPYADKLLLGVTLGQNYKEIQTGARMVSVFGAWHRRGNMLMPTLKYQKRNLLVKGLDVTLNANYNFGKEQNIDTLFRRYDWFGKFKEYEGTGGERSRTMYKYGNNNGLLTSTFSYQLSDKHSVTLNNVFSTFDRKGKDELYPENDSYQQPRKTNKDILGLAYRYDLANKWSATVFGKFLWQQATTGVRYNPTGNWGDEAFRDETNVTKQLGYGAAVSYFIRPELQLKASYEKSNRMPENYELFGDLENQEANFELKPESSDNVNLGVAYSFGFQDDHRFALSANAIYRYATDYIYSRLNNNQSKLVAQNLDGVSNIGGDVQVRYSFRNWLTAGVNMTYQDVRNEQKYEPNYTGISPVYQDRMPNLPFLFGNGDVSVFLNDVGRKGNTLSVGYNLLYVHAFYLYWPSRGNREGKYDVPQQWAHDANIVYTLADGKYNIALECKNLTDALLYDNFSLQKPSRAFFLKLRYFISK
ncbi:outer membrane receptor protein involved in Fe transport [Anseongella ginsenosidimutans]|uniref:Outer membrane receptor protein involved in Fe transport n=1 Tax=Anseongella ginsenosidimutans TaxID=496056 RepID=A0A4R3KWR3_9SPHI|nr:TonB-dependent receptor [Anseongella ginsenosidimutans]QEC51108.1 TonB-dependent receptor [Anseongella ginsenosidimutans]TCS90229.1 outer membrane receptor protein involved in Fe transport [Anseongella ginsenosidimutans]